jgi:hypothetical protein
MRVGMSNLGRCSLTSISRRELARTIRFGSSAGGERSACGAFGRVLGAIFAQRPPLDTAGEARVATVKTHLHTRSYLPARWGAPARMNELLAPSLRINAALHSS